MITIRAPRPSLWLQMNCFYAPTSVPKPGGSYAFQVDQPFIDATYPLGLPNPGDKSWDGGEQGRDRVSGLPRIEIMTDNHIQTAKTAIGTTVYTL
jgi:hypothetical protein